MLRAGNTGTGNGVPSTGNCESCCIQERIWQFLPDGRVAHHVQAAEVLVASVEVPLEKVIYVYRLTGLNSQDAIEKPARKENGMMEFKGAPVKFIRS